MGFSFIDSASYLLTSESVTEGHPDKLCDLISDGVLDSILERDPEGRGLARQVSPTVSWWSWEK